MNADQPSTTDTRERGPENSPARLLLRPFGDPSRTRPKPLGISDADTSGALVGLHVVDARHHLHVLGPTGTGKSTLLLNYTMSEVRAGRGVAVFDPKGDLTRDLLDRLPPEAAERLVLIDPDETQAPAALNLLQLAEDPYDTADQLVGVMAKVWASTWGPRTDDLARHALLTLMRLPGASLADLPTLLANPRLRQAALRRADDRDDDGWGVDLHAFWSWWDSQSPALAAQQLGPLLSKLRAVLSRRFAAGLFGVPRSTFRLEEILNGGILLVRLPKAMGDDTVRLTGSLLLAALLHTAGRRAAVREAERLDASLIVDECHQFVNLPIGLDDALAETRALRLSMLLAHQHLGQLSKPVRDAIDANARSKVYFALAPADADALVHHVKPYFAADDLIHRDAYGMVCRLVIRGRNAEPFTLRARPAPPVWPGRAELLRAAARNRGLPLDERRKLADARRLGPAVQRARRTQQPDELDLLDADRSADSGPILPPGGTR
nr:type IV secretion system DNA-binding domain-containing protein [Hamadaea flava]